MSNGDSKHNQFAIVQFANDAIVADTIAPSPFHVANQAMAKLACVRSASDFVPQKLRDQVCYWRVQLCELFFRIRLEPN